MTIFSFLATFEEDDDEDPDEEEDDDMDAGDDDHGNPFSSFLARLADHRMGGMGAMGGGGPYDRLLRGLHSDKPYERQAALDEVSQVRSGAVISAERRVVSLI